MPPEFRAEPSSRTIRANVATPEVKPRMRRPDGLLVAFALVLVLVALLWDSLFGGMVLTQADALYEFAPWNALAPDGFKPSNGLLLDQSTGFLPWMDFQAEQLWNGELPLWNPYNYCGEPLVGTYQSALYWPLNWIYFVWPSWHAHAWMALVRLWLAGFFTFLFLRRLGVGAGAAAVGGLGYMMSGFMVAWLNHPQVSCALFLPGMLWAVERLSGKPGPRRAAVFSLLFGLQLFAGHVQTAMHHGIFTAAYAGFLILVSNKGMRHRVMFAVWLVVAVVFGVILAAPQWLPFLEYLGHSQAVEVFERMQTVGRQGGVSRAAVLMIDPMHYGAPHTHDYQGPLGPNLNYNELIGGYVGRVLVLLALAQALWIGWRKKSSGPTLFFVGVVVISGLVAFQVEPFYSFFDSIPRLRSTKLMRVLQFVAFGLAVLGAMGLERLVSKSRFRLWWIFGVFALIAGEQLWFARGYNPQVEPEVLVPQTKVTDYLRENQGLHRTIGVDGTILKPNANLFYRINMVSGYDSMEDKNLSDLVQRLTTAPPKYPFISQIGAFNNVKAFPLMNLMGVRFFLGPNTYPLPPPLQKKLSAELDVYENPNVMPRAFLARDFKIIPKAKDRLDYLSSAEFDPWTVVLADNAALPEECGACITSQDSTEEVEIVEYSPRKVEIRASADRAGILVFTDVWDPGWSAEIVPADAPDDPATEVTIHRVDHAFRGVSLTEGEWLVRFRYDPWSSRLGGWLCLGALLTLTLFSLRRNRSPAKAVG